MSGIDIIKPVKNHPEELCCTECWQRGISWGADGREEEIIKLLEELKGDQEGCCDECKPHLDRSRNYLDAVIALIKGERSKEEQIADLMWLSEQQLIAENKREGENK